MTAPDLSPAERAVVDRFEAAPWAEESLHAVVCTAILYAVLGDTDGGLVVQGDLPAEEIARLIVEQAADAAIAVMRGER